MKSIIQDEKECWYCGAVYNLHKHHIIYSAHNRANSERYGLWCYLCAEHHTGYCGVHNAGGKHIDDRLKRVGQEAFEKDHRRDEWREIFGKSYL